MSDLVKTLRGRANQFRYTHPVDAEIDDKAANTLEAKDAEIERLEFAIEKMGARQNALQAVVDYVQTIDHLQANEYLHELITALGAGGNTNE